jgi:hypothetical protein
MPAFECLDLTPRTRGDAGNIQLDFETLSLAPARRDTRPLNYDRHGLKPNMRNNQFYVMRYDQEAVARRPRHMWNVQPILTWQQVLTELVGYTRYAQAQITAASYCPLDEARTLCARERARLADELSRLSADRQEHTVLLMQTLLREQPHAPNSSHSRTHSQDLATPMRLLAQMRSL